MQSTDRAEKKRIFYNGQEIPGLVSLGPLRLEKNTLEVPGFSITRKIQNGVTKLPDVDLTYKIPRDNSAYVFFRDWYLNDEEKDLVVERVDASGQVIARTLLQACQCTVYEEPEYDAASPTFAKVTVKLVPYDMVPIDA